MNRDWINPLTWYRDIAATYSSAQRCSWYSSVAEAYYRTRPRYPQQLIDRAIAHLPPQPTLLEIGCGPGIATLTLAQQGATVVGLEPSREACDLARQSCAAYPQVQILNNSFESWELEPARFDGVVAATSFHWVAPEIAFPRSAAALKEKGLLILLWNLIPQPPVELCQKLRPVYERYSPDLGHYEDPETQERNLSKLEVLFSSSDLFEPIWMEQVVSTGSYTIADYIALLSTLTPYIKLEAQIRDQLFTALQDVLEQQSQTAFPTTHLSALQIARKRP